MSESYFNYDFIQRAIDSAIVCLHDIAKGHDFVKGMRLAFAVVSQAVEGDLTYADTLIQYAKQNRGNPEEPLKTIVGMGHLVDNEAVVCGINFVSSQVALSYGQKEIRMYPEGPKVKLMESFEQWLDAGEESRSVLRLASKFTSD